MTFALVALSITVACLATTLAAGVVAYRTQTRRLAALEGDGYASLVGARVTANVRDGGAIRGVLTHVYDNALVLAHPEWIGATRPEGIGTEVMLDRASVPMLQRFEDQA